MASRQCTSLEDVALICNALAAEILTMMVGNPFRYLLAWTNNKVTKCEHYGVSYLVTELYEFVGRFRKPVKLVPYFSGFIYCIMPELFISNFVVWDNWNTLAESFSLNNKFTDFFIFYNNVV